MSMDRIRERLVRRIASPVEVLYDITTHWVLMVVAIALGFLLMYAKVKSDPPVYEVVASIQLNPNEITLDKDARRAPSRTPDLALQTFITEQLALLMGDTVIEKVALQIGDDSIMQQEGDLSDAEGGSLLQRMYRRLAEGVNALLESFERQPEGSIQERLRQKAKLSFQRRSFAVNEPRTSIVRLGVRGTRRENLKDELLAWIDAYRSRIDEISQETYERLFDERIDHWVKQEKEAKQRLDRFRTENPDVSAVRQKFNLEKVVRLQILKDQIQSQRIIGGAPGPLGLPLPGGGTEPIKFPPLAGEPAPPPKDEVLLQKERQLAEMEKELLILKGNYPAASDKVRNYESAVRGMRADVQRMRDPLTQLRQPPFAPPLPDQPPGVDREQIEAERQKQVDDMLKERSAFLAANIKEIDEELNRTITEQSALEDKMSELTALVDAHKRAFDIRWQFETLLEQKREENESRKVVNIQILDRPVVSVRPIGSDFQKVGLGTLAGAALGLFLAFGVELFSRRVRFKRDVEDDLGLMVVGVIPEK